MANCQFISQMEKLWTGQKFLCIGLDCDSNQLPSGVNQFDFNKQIIDSTFDLVCSFKLNSAFYEAEGVSGLEALEQTIKYIHQIYPQIPVILDAKRGDIGNTNQAYAKAIFDNLGADAMTVHPYLGKESLEPFLKRKDKGIFVLVKTSNPGVGEFQDLQVDGKPLYQIVAQHVKDWNTNGNLGVVVGATYPEELKKVREIIGDMPILIPGVGAQGGDIQGLKNAVYSNGQGIIVSSSRGIIFSDNPRQATLDLSKQITEALK